METQPTSLYERLGGIYNIATVVDDFIDRIMVDDRLNANPRVDEAHHRVLPPGFKYLVTEQVGEATGGPQRYTGRSMEDSHRDLLITGGHLSAALHRTSGRRRTMTNTIGNEEDKRPSERSSDPALLRSSRSSRGSLLLPRAPPATEFVANHASTPGP